MLKQLILGGAFMLATAVPAQAQTFIDGSQIDEIVSDTGISRPSWRSRTVSK